MLIRVRDKFFDEMKSLYLSDGKKCWNPQMVWQAIALGHLECAKYALDNGCSINLPSYGFEEIKIIHEQLGVELYDVNLCMLAAEDGNIEFLTYIHEHGGPWDEYTCIGASTLECLKYAHEHGCPWNSGVLMRAIMYDQMDQYEYAVKNGLWWGDDPSWDICSLHLIIDINKWSDDFILQKLNQLVELGCSVGSVEKIASDGIIINNLALVKFAISQGLPLTIDLAIKATMCDSDTILRFLYDECGLRIPQTHNFSIFDTSQAGRAFLEERGYPNITIPLLSALE